MPNYSDSIIYKLCCRNTDIKETYIGSTTNFSRRKSEHKKGCNNSNHLSYNFDLYKFIRKNGCWDNFDMIQIENYNAKDKRDLHSRERYWIEKLKPELNKSVPTRTKKEYCIDNKNLLNEKSRKYRKENTEYFKNYEIKNKDNISERKKIYYQTNKKKFKEKLECDCGSMYLYSNKKNHWKTKKHIFWQKTYDYIYN
jgi:hypothetical protein